MRIIKPVTHISMENGVVHYGVEFYSDDDLKSWALVSSFEALMSPFPPHHQANIEGFPFSDLNIYLW